MEKKSTTKSTKAPSMKSKTSTGTTRKTKATAKTATATVSPVKAPGFHVHVKPKGAGASCPPKTTFKRWVETAGTTVPAVTKFWIGLVAKVVLVTAEIVVLAVVAVK